MWLSRASCIAIIFITMVYTCQDCGFYEKKWSFKMFWCRLENQVLYTGDFNGDGQTDLLCYDQSKKTIWTAYAQADGSFTGTQWFSGSGRFCTMTSEVLYIGDFDGDGRDDILCHRQTNGRIKISVASKEGQFSGVQWKESFLYCVGVDKQVFVGNFNGDKKADLLCHHKNDGFKEVAYTKGKIGFSGVNWQLSMFWCYKQAKSQIYIGDFNGDGLSDMLCSENLGGKYIAYAKRNSKRLFTNTDTLRKLDTCLEDGDNSFIRIGDVNGDKKDDLICHSATGVTSVVLMHSKRGFADYPTTTNLCKFNRTGFFVGYFNKDNRADVLCHDQVEGDKTIRYAECPDIDA